MQQWVTGPTFRSYRWTSRPAGLYLQLTLHTSSHLRDWNVLLSFSPPAQLATTDSSFRLSSNITSAGHLSQPPRAGQAHHGLPPHDKYHMNVILVTFESFLLILPHWTVSSIRSGPMPGSPAHGRLPGTQLACSECSVSERMDKASVIIGIV